MADPLREYATAIYTRLSGVSVPVYDYVPDDTDYPYVQIDRYLLTPIDVLASRKDEIQTYLTVFTNYRGQKQVFDVMEEIYALFHQAQFSVSTGRVIRCFVDSRTTTRNMDDLTFMGEVVLRGLVEH